MDDGDVDQLAAIMWEKRRRDDGEWDIELRGIIAVNEAQPLEISTRPLRLLVLWKTGGGVTLPAVWSEESRRLLLELWGKARRQWE